MSTVPMRVPYLDPAAPALLARAPVPRRALFLDRDGVINQDHGYVHTAEATTWVPGIFALVASAHRLGYLPIVVTNQAGIARGYYDEAAFLEYTGWLHRQFAEHGAPLLATFWCPHHPEAGLGLYRVECDCRKPRAGMLQAAIAQFGLDPAASRLLGDRPTDLAAAATAGVPARRLDPSDWGAPLAQLLEHWP